MAHSRRPSRQAVDATGAEPGDRVLVTGALGSVGRSAVQYLRELGVAVGGAVLPSQLGEAKALGLEAVALSEGSNQREFDHAVETVGGPVAALAIASVKEGGSVAGSAGFPEDANGDGRVKVINVLSGDDAAMLQKIADAAGRGELRLPIAQTVPLDQLAQAYDLLATRPDGKVIIQH